MQQYWLIEKRSEDGIRRMYFCNADGREMAKQLASRFLLGNPDEYTVIPISGPGDVVQLRINIYSTNL